MLPNIFLLCFALVHASFPTSSFSDATGLRDFSEEYRQKMIINFARMMNRYISPERDTSDMGFSLYLGNSPAIRTVFNPILQTELPLPVGTSVSIPNPRARRIGTRDAIAAFRIFNVKDVLLKFDSEPIIKEIVLALKRVNQAEFEATKERLQFLEMICSNENSAAGPKKDNQLQNSRAFKAIDDFEEKKGPASKL
jgi:hypothetical protein